LLILLCINELFGASVLADADLMVCADLIEHPERVNFAQKFLARYAKARDGFSLYHFAIAQSIIGEHEVANESLNSAKANPQGMYASMISSLLH
jgi:hypothetical protein